MRGQLLTDYFAHRLAFALCWVSSAMLPCPPCGPPFPPLHSRSFSDWDNSFLACLLSSFLLPSLFTGLFPPGFPPCAAAPSQMRTIRSSLAPQSAATPAPSLRASWSCGERLGTALLL